MKPEYKLGKNLIRIKFSNDEGNSEYSLDFRLYDHSVAQRWMKMMLQTQALGGGRIIQDGIFFGNGVNDRAQVVSKLDRTVDIHNDFCKKNNLDDCIIPIKTDHPVTQSRLSKLHEYFEAYAEDERFALDEPIRMNLQDMNLLIHRLESCLDETSKACHVEILSEYYMKYPLKGDDYKLFDLDTIWGQLVLTYGITGVPTSNAFWSHSEPTPQNFVTNGMILSFWGDHIFDKRDELAEWLKTKNLDINNPESALGYIGLGKIERLEQLDREEILKSIAAHTKVVSYQFMIDESHVPVQKEQKKAPAASPSIKKTIAPIVSTASATAQWPFDQEIFYHLDLVPYIDLQVKFDAAKLLEEAKKALSYFVVHRDYDQQSGADHGKWKSLGLRSLFGDYTKTQYHTSYTFEGKAEYQNTVFSELCPETMKFLDSITDINQCERIRFMLLEPGASINVHRDSKERDVSLAVNISLNMPEGCDFYAQLNADGTSNPYTVKLPFKDTGSVLLYNNAKYHRVINNSNVPRIHMIFHGPTRFNDELILKLARQQNNIHDRKDLLKKLIQKKAAIGEELTKTPSLFSDWLSSGLSHDTLPESFALAVYDHETYHEGGSSDLYLKKRTVPTLFPLAHTVIQENEWDNFLKKSFNEGKEFAILFAAGSFILDLSPFIKELIMNCHELKSKGWPAAGHLMDFNNGKHLPYFHEQFIIINLKAWNEIGQIALGPLFDMVEADLKNVDVASEKIHDDYTPLYIQASHEKSDKVVRRGLLGWGSALIRKAVESGKGVLNISNGLRDLKLYAYPRDTLEESRNKIEKTVGEKLNYSKNEVFCFNNEVLGILKVSDLKPTKLISVAAGFKPFHILKQFHYPHDAQVHFADFSANALEYVKSLTQQDSLNGIVGTIYEEVKKKTTRNLAPGVPESLLTSTVRDYFDGEESELIDNIQKAKHATFNEINLILEPHRIAHYLNEGERFVVWTSNAFYNNQLYLLLTPEEADAKLLEVVIHIAKKTSLRAYRLKNSYSFAFGKGLDFIRGILTDGAAQEAQFSKEYWDEIKY